MSVKTDKMKAVFLEALNKTTAAERTAFLDGACAGDASLRQSIEALLRAHDQADPLLDHPAAEHLDGSASEGVGPDDPLDFLDPPSKPDSLGRIGHYEILEVLGRGGFGIVLRAFDDKLQRVVAIKALAPQLAATSPARKRFLREARSAAAVRHENIVAIYSVDDKPLPYLAMEYIAGQTLQQKLDACGPLEVPDVLRIGRQIAAGLAAAHATGLIHRDIKPSNILLENPIEIVKITDFGLARAADDASVTQSGLIAGTPMYMSPEQALGETIDQRADLFSLGSVLYTMCSGLPPFRAGNSFAVLKRVTEDAPRPIREIIPEVPEWMCDIIMRLQAKRPEDRIGTAKEVADLLARGQEAMQWAGNVPNVERNSFRSSPSKVMNSVLPIPALRRPFFRTRRWAVAAAGLLLFLGGLGFTEATEVTNLSGTIIRLFSPEGTLVVEVDDPGVSIKIDGSDIVITGAGVKEIRLKPGQYKVEASKDGKVVRQELVAVTRNGRQVVRISKEADSIRHVSNVPDPWEKAVAGLPAEQQVKAVVRRLKELNPAFDGTVTPTVENGVVTRLTVPTDDVDDISPVRALPGLVMLECHGAGRGKLSDLSPLQGLRLTVLDCSGTQVADLSPLRGMPLTVLLARGTQVSDLSPLQGMPLKVLTLQQTAVTSLAPLKGMPLTFLDVAAARGISDLSPLQDMPLEYLNLGDQPVSDLAPLTSLKSLRRLLLDSTSASNLTPLRGLDLKELSIRNIPAKDLSPLKEMALKGLRLDYRADLAEFVRSFTALESINDKPPADFWKEVEGK